MSAAELNQTGLTTASRPEGVRQAKQQRSQAKQDALLAAGRCLLASHDLPSLSVAQVAAAAGVAVGSFYSRFDDKNAWFAELCRQAGSAAFAELQALLGTPAMRRANVAKQVALLMRWLVQVHRDHQGIFRAAVSDPARTQLYWGPLMRLCDQMVELVHAQLALDLLAMAPVQRRQRVGFAFQMVFATLAQAVLHDAGPVRLHDETLAGELARSFLALAGMPAAAEVTPSGKATKATVKVTAKATAHSTNKAVAEAAPTAALKSAPKAPAS